MQKIAKRKRGIMSRQHANFFKKSNVSNKLKVGGPSPEDQPYGVITALEQQTNTIESHQLSFKERFSLFIDRGIIDRGNRRITDLLRKARLRYLACVEDID
jgi:hypothetical protein